MTPPTLEEAAKGGVDGVAAGGVEGVSLLAPGVAARLLLLPESDIVDRTMGGDVAGAGII